MECRYECPPRAVMICIDVRIDRLSRETLGNALRLLVSEVGTRRFKFYAKDNYDAASNAPLLTLQAISEY